VNLNATLFAQLVVFFILALFTMKYVWPPLMKALDERANKISEGLAAAERGKHELAVAEKRVQVELQQVHDEPTLSELPRLLLVLVKWLHLLATPRSHLLNVRPPHP